ncbi:MAG: ATP-binding protein [Bacteroidales bacterium]|nr:ATP-binding protein [Bacteroidales bacterium]
MYYKRILEENVLRALENYPVTAVTGPRQCGKSTLAKHIIGKEDRKTLYLDLEKPSDLRKLDNPEWFLRNQRGTLVCLDEIQRKPDLFPLIRSLMDDWGGNGHFLILGSASRDMIRQSSESLAGRISYKRLTPFLYNEIQNISTTEEYLVKGGFPRSLLQEDFNLSFEWRKDFISTFLERDLLMWSGFSPATMGRLWQMIAHINGQIINYSMIGNSLGVSSQTVRNYVDLLASTFMVRLLPPSTANTGKRITKSPKVYITDTGISNALLDIPDFNNLAGHPGAGAAWEAMVLANLTGNFPHLNYSCYRTGHGAEIDIIAGYGRKRIAVECKLSENPGLSKGNYSVIEDLNPSVTFVVSPVSNGWSMQPGIEVVNLPELIEAFPEYLE